jgi:hypothetical protein
MVIPHEGTAPDLTLSEGINLQTFRRSYAQIVSPTIFSFQFNCLIFQSSLCYQATKYDVEKVKTLRLGKNSPDHFQKVVANPLKENAGF